MPNFVRTALKIEASRRRVTALWFGDVNRVALQSDPQFTGSAILAAIFTLSGHYQYYVIFLSLSHKVIETWRVEPTKIPISESAVFEKKVINDLNAHGIELTPIPADTPMHHKILTILPMAFDDQNQTAPANLFDVPDDNTFRTSNSLSDDEIRQIHSFLKLF